MTHASLPEGCKNCMLRPMFCDIDVQLEKASKQWIGFATQCNQISELERILRVESAGINKFDREQILDATYPFFFSTSLLVFPVEIIKRVLSDKFSDVFPEYTSNLQMSDHIKWTLRLEIINKFCQLSETLAAHLLASKKAGTNYDSYSGYTSKLIEYNVDEAVELFENLSEMKDEEISKIMCYPDKEKQSDEAKALLGDSVLFLRTGLNVVGEEYIKFKELHKAYKHGCRMLHPQTMTMEGENFVACIMYLTRKATITKGGQLNLLGFPNDDFTSFFRLIDSIYRILSVMLHNRKNRYLLSKELSEDVSVALYFPKDLGEIYANKTTVEFTL